MPHTIAYFISPHGFGHAARAAAVMSTLYQIDPSIQFEIFTTVPRWFFEQSLPGPFNYHPVVTDIGLVQHDPLREDPSATVERLDEFLPFIPRVVTLLVEQVEQAACELVVCDIAPLGIAVAQQAAIPSVLEENFTWDWIYESYVDQEPRLREHIGFLWHMFGMVDYRVQTEPVCVYHPAALTTPPVSRAPRARVEDTRAQLSIPAYAPAVMITMGGMEARYEFLHQLNAHPNVYFIIPGGSTQRQHQGNVVLLPHHSQFYHPDLIRACNAVVGKLGYSTVAETYAAGVPLAYIPRAQFPESPVMAEFVKSRMQGLEIEAEKFKEGGWLARLDELLALPRLQRNEPNGSHQVADFLYKLL